LAKFLIIGNPIKPVPTKAIFKWELSILSGKT
jgi:hypothetical protein